MVTVVGPTVDSVVLRRVTETTPPLVAVIVVDVDDDELTDELLRCVCTGRGELADVSGACVVLVGVADCDELAAAGAGAAVVAVAGAAVVRRVVDVPAGGGVAGFGFGSKLSTTPTGPFRSISVSGHVISSAWIE